MQRPRRLLSRMPRAPLKGWEERSNMMSPLGSDRVINANVPKHKHRDHVFLDLSYRFGSKITLSTFLLEVTLLGHEKLWGELRFYKFTFQLPFTSLKNVFAEGLTNSHWCRLIHVQQGLTKISHLSIAILSVPGIEQGVVREVPSGGTEVKTMPAI